MGKSIQTWFYALGTDYGVDPIIFGAIYIGAIPFFMASIAWLVRNQRQGRSITLPVIFAGCFFVSAYVYLAIAGKNIPIWVWMVLAALVTYGIWSTIRSVRKKIGKTL